MLPDTGDTSHTPSFFVHPCSPIKMFSFSKSAIFITVWILSGGTISPVISMVPLSDTILVVVR